MRRLVLAGILMFGVGCAQPQYTVLNDGTGKTNTTTTTQAVEWPDLSKWEESSTGPTDVGIIVAIEDYAFLPAVPGAIENANDWEAYLKVGRGASRVYTITNKQATSEEIKRFVKQAASEAGPESTVWFVFIGHGAPAADGKDGALVAMDAQQTVNSLQSRSVKRQELVGLLETGAQKQTVVVLDTCFSGKDPNGELLAQGTQPVIPTDQAQPNVVGRTVVLTAAASNEVAGQLPGAERPAFSYLLLGAMRGWADSGDGNVGAAEARDYVAKEFRHLKGRQQTPGIYGTGDVVLASNAKEVDPGVSDYIKGGGTVTVTVNTPVDPTGEQVIDTNTGLIFTQPKGWAVGPAGMGVALTLQSMHGGSQIVVERYETSASNAAMFFANGQDPEFMGNAKVVEKPKDTTYGNTFGAESKVRENDPNFGKSETTIFETYQSGVAYRFKLIIKNPEKAERHTAAFQEFLKKVRFKTPPKPAAAAPTPSQKNESAKLQFEVFKYMFEQVKVAK